MCQHFYSSLNKDLLANAEELVTVPALETYTPLGSVYVIVCTEKQCSLLGHAYPLYCFNSPNNCF